VAARYAAVAVGPAGRVVGVDIDAGMIEVARSMPPISGPPGSQAPIDWRQENAYRLPVLNQSVDLALCAQTLQFLTDPGQALAEMHRALKPGGRAALSLWMPMIDNPYFHSLVDIVTEHIGAETASWLKAIFNLTDPNQIRALLRGAGFPSISFAAKELVLPLPAISDFVPRHISATPMQPGFGSAPAAARQAVLEGMATRMATFTRDGRLRVPFCSHLVLAFR
jgi:ubiquinone/menaquinone biosynthesis C-methylase UbiE